jgi:hypothetical protein
MWTLAILKPSRMSGDGLMGLEQTALMLRCTVAGPWFQPTPCPGNNGNNSYFLWDNGNPLLGVQATVDIDEAFISTDQGFSFQLNCWSQEGANFIPNWQQFIIWDAQGGTVLGANLDFFIAPDENDNKHEIIRLKESLATVPIPTTIGQLQWA